MSLPPETMLELMALADGELEGEAKERAEKLAAQNEEAQRVVEVMRAPGIRRWMGDAVEHRARLADGIADAVMARLEAADEHVAIRRLPSARSGQSWRVVVARGSIAASALALAAAFAIYARTGERGSERAPVANVGMPSRETIAAPGVATAMARQGSPESARGVEVEEIDSAAHVSIFEIPALANASAPSSVVVWIEDDPGEK